jgi:hypothetical protein
MDPTLFGQFMQQNVGSGAGSIPSYMQPTSGAYQPPSPPSGLGGGQGGQGGGQSGAPTDFAGINNVLSQAGAGMNSMYNQYAPGMMQNAYDQGQYMQSLGNQLSGAYGGLQTGANSILNTAFDPQNALYARTQQQLQDQTNSALSQRGIGMSPYGAGVASNAMSNFNIDWQNQQLQRQATGLGAAGTALGQYGAGVAGGQGLAAQGVNLPANMQSTLFSNQNSALQPFQQVQGNNLQEQQLQQQQQQAQEALMMQYMGMQQKNQQQQYQNQMGQLGGLGSALGSFGGASGSSLFGKLGGGLAGLFGF